MSVELEVRVPISPTPDFFRRIHFMAASLRRLEQDIGPHLLVVCVGGDVEPHDLHQAQPWSKDYPIVWQWADREKFRRDSYWETSREIFRQPIRGRIVMCADADVIFVRDFSELLRDLHAEPAVAGVIAHAPPIRGPELTELWPRLVEGYGVPTPPPIHEYTGWSFMTADRVTPVYYNFGMVLMPAALMETLSPEMEPADNFVNATIETFFRFQIALTLSIQKANLPSRALPLRYNFPNDPQFDQNYPNELAQVHILHYLRCETVNRERDFADPAAVAALIARSDLGGSNEILRATLAELYPAVASEEGAGAASHATRSRSSLGKLIVPDELQRNAPDVLADGVENTGEWLLLALAERLERTDLAGLDLLDLGCGVRFAQTLVNRQIPFGSYTGIEVSQPIITWLKEEVEKFDERFRFVHWNVRNAMYNPGAPPMAGARSLPVTGPFDIITAYSVFTHLDPQDSLTLLRLAREAVKSTGYLFFTAFCDPAVKKFEDRVPGRPLLNAYYAPDYLAELVSASGWRVLSHRPPEGYMMDSFLCQALSTKT